MSNLLKSNQREIGRLLSNRLSNVRLKLEINSVKAGLKKCVVFFCFFAVNTQYVIKHQV